MLFDDQKSHGDHDGICTMGFPGQCNCSKNISTLLNLVFVDCSKDYLLFEICLLPLLSHPKSSLCFRGAFFVGLQIFVRNITGRLTHRSIAVSTGKSVLRILEPISSWFLSERVSKDSLLAWRIV